MVRKTGIKVRISPTSYGAYVAEPVSKQWRKLFADHILEWKYTGNPQGIPEHELCKAYFQGAWELPSNVVLNRQYPDLCTGWDIVILVDPWDFGHWLGYDAHTVTYTKG